MLLDPIYSHVVEDFNIFVHTHVGTFPLPHCFLSALGLCWPHLHELDSVLSDSQVRMGQGLSRCSSRRHAPSPYPVTVPRTVWLHLGPAHCVYPRPTCCATCMILDLLMVTSENNYWTHARLERQWKKGKNKTLAFCYVSFFSCFAEQLSVFYFSNIHEMSQA